MSEQTKAIEDGGPAFPHPTECSDGRGIPYLGMTLRDYFAAKALAGLLADPKEKPHKKQSFKHFCREIAAGSYAYADAMIEARKGGFE
jgi:hypothetical protein